MLDPVESPILQTSRLTIRMANKEDLQTILSYFRINEHHLVRSGPTRSAAFLTFRYWHRQVQLDSDDLLADKALRLFVFEKDSGTVIGTVNFNAILRGAAQFCYLGYGLSADKQGQGLMFEAVNSALLFAFTNLKLHRVMANYMPNNKRSGDLLRRLGFVEEGFAKDYLFLNGRWCDHVMTSLTEKQLLAARAADGR